MKKLLLVAASTALISSAAFAQEDCFYVRGDVGVSHFMSEKAKTGHKLKTNHAPLLSLGVGYGLMDTVRAELELTHHFNPELSKSASGTYDGIAFDGKYKSKIQATALMLKGIVDLFDAGPAKFFVGAGVGMAQVKEKVSFDGTPAALVFSAKTKAKNNVAYTALAGAAFEVAPNVMLDVTYSYNSYGKTKGKDIALAGETYTLGNTRLHAHVGKIGFRFAL